MPKKCTSDERICNWRNQDSNWVFSDSQTKTFNQQHRLSQHFAEKSGVLFFEVVSEKGELGLRKKSR